jgi:hypothetical protein
MKKILQPVQWRTPMGKLTLLPERGRVLQVTVGGHAAFWTNSRWSGDWNVGGDRLWVSPETDWHWQTRKRIDWSRYEVPASFDPGGWKAADRQPGYCRVWQRCRIKHQHRAGGVEVEMARSFSRVDLDQAPHFERCLAYHTDNELRVLDGIPGQAVGLWSLAQVPAGGKLLLPCRMSPAFRLYFGAISPALWARSERLATFSITGRHQYKVGLAPALVNGRMIYARRVVGGYLAIVREFHPQPWRAYCDRPMNALAKGGDAVQVYNDGGEFGGFGEMEYHSPAVVVGRGHDLLQDSCLTIIGLIKPSQWRAWNRYWVR